MSRHHFANVAPHGRVFIRDMGDRMDIVRTEMLGGPRSYPIAETMLTDHTHAEHVPSTCTCQGPWCEQESVPAILHALERMELDCGAGDCWLCDTRQTLSFA